MQLGMNYFNRNKQYKLIDLYNDLYKENKKQRHNASNDVDLCIKCFFKINLGTSCILIMHFCYHEAGYLICYCWFFSCNVGHHYLFWNKDSYSRSFQSQAVPEHLPEHLLEHLPGLLWGLLPGLLSGLLLGLRPGLLPGLLQWPSPFSPLLLLRLEKCCVFDPDTHCTWLAIFGFMRVKMTSAGCSLLRLHL